MTAESPAVLESLLRGNGLGWMIDMYARPGRAIPYLLELLGRVAAEYAQRIHVNVPFTPEALAAEAENNPHKVRAFLQAMGTTHSPEMLVMVWRILQDLQIREVELRYREQQMFSLIVVLARPGGDNGDELETYRSEDINDAALIRHFGITTVDRLPLFDGFFPNRKPSRSTSSDK
jgi:hypothetical protein